MSTIETGVAIPPEEPPKKKPRARRAIAKKTEGPNPAASLLAALKFIAVAQKKSGTVQQTHSMISGNWAAASNGVLTVATKIEEDLNACPHTGQLIDALSKVGGDLSLTQLPNALSIVSGALKAVVSCVEFVEVQITAPDEQCAVIDDRIKAAFDAVAGLATDGAQHAYLAAVLLQGGSAVATNGAALLEYWHGIDLPPGLLIPKASAVAIAKTSKTLTGFGFSPSSATFWFEDGSFMKTQLFGEQYPHYRGILEADGLNPWPLPDEFFKAVRAIESFSRNGIVYFKNGVLSSNEREEEASTYKIEGLPEGMGFNAKYLLAVEHAFKNVHFDEEANKAYFFSEGIRGVLMGIDKKAETSYDATNEDDNFPPF